MAGLPFSVHVRADLFDHFRAATALLQNRCAYKGGIAYALKHIVNRIYVEPFDIFALDDFIETAVYQR